MARIFEFPKREDAPASPKKELMTHKLAAFLFDFPQTGTVVPTLSERAKRLLNEVNESLIQTDLPEQQ